MYVVMADLSWLEYTLYDSKDFVLIQQTFRKHSLN